MNGSEFDLNEDRTQISMNKTRDKVLVVCMLDSIHTARWLSIFANSEIDFYLFPSTPNRKLHEQLKNLIRNSDFSNANFNLSSFVSKTSPLIWLSGMLTNLLVPALLIKRIIRKNQITKIHAIELNHAGYLVAKAFALGMPKNIKVICTNWGSDIYWFQNQPKHLKKIKNLLQITNFYSAECTRDVELAYKYGYKGLVNEVFPNTGGFSLNEITQAQVKPSERKAIVVKGYENFAGRASIALAAIEQVSEKLIDFEILVYSANRKTKKIAAKIGRNKNLKIQVFSKKSLSHDDVMKLFRKSRIYIGVSLSDAISTSLLEAMVCGTYPIQTDTSCANEWITPNLTGSIVKPELGAVRDALLKALSDDTLVNEAAGINSQVAKKRLDKSNISKKLEKFYTF